MQRILIPLIACASLLSTTTHAQSGEAPSFDCQKARSWAELSICADPRLARLDRRMAQHYGELRSQLSEARQQQLLEDQRGFLAERERCQHHSGDVRDCLIRVYQARLAFLASQVGGVDEPPPTPAAATSALEECWEVVDNRVELAPCLDRKLDSATAWLERAQQQTLTAMLELDRMGASDRADAQTAYQTAQEAFYRFRDTNCAWHAAAMGGGTGQGDAYRACLVDMTRQRAMALERQSAQP